MALAHSPMRECENASGEWKSLTTRIRPIRFPTPLSMTVNLSPYLFFLFIYITVGEQMMKVEAVLTFWGLSLF